MIKNAEGKINEKITYARITIQKKKIKEPIDYFYPSRSLGCSEPCIDLEILKKQEKFVEYKSRQVIHNGKLCQKTYHRIFIQKIS